MTTMKPYIVRQGDYLDSIAARHGMTGERLWDHAANSEIRDTRADRNMLAPGDIVKVPASGPEPLPVNLGAANTFTAVIPKSLVRVRLCSSDDEPYANVPFQLEGIKTTNALTTDGDGIAEFRPPTDVREVIITIPSQKRRISIKIGELDPHDESSGTWQRLANMGYCTHEATSEDSTGEELAAAMERFQKAQGLPETGRADNETLQALQNAHSR